MRESFTNYQIPWHCECQKQENNKVNIQVSALQFNVSACRTDSYSILGRILAKWFSFTGVNPQEYKSAVTLQIILCIVGQRHHVDMSGNERDQYYII